MHPTSFPFPSSQDKENATVIKGGGRATRDALIAARVITKPTNTARTQERCLMPTNQDSHASSALQSPPRITILKNPARERPLPSIQKVLSSPTSQSTPRITILNNPERSRPLPSIQSVLSSSAPQSPPRITILQNPARARPLPPNQSTPSSSASQSAPRITILTNPVRVRPSSSPQSSERIPNVSATAAALKRAPASAPFPTESVPAGVHPTLAAARAALKKVQPIPIPTSLRIVVHEPYSWDERTDVHLPPTGHRKLLGVPAVDVRGKLRKRELARHYPKEYAAEVTLRRHRPIVRNGSNLSS